MRGHAVLVLQDQALLQRHRHGRAVLGALAAGEPDPIETAADLPTGKQAALTGGPRSVETPSKRMGQRTEGPATPRPTSCQSWCWQQSLPMSGLTPQPPLLFLLPQDIRSRPRPPSLLRCHRPFTDLTRYPLPNYAHTILSRAALWSWPLRGWGLGAVKTTSRR